MIIERWCLCTTANPPAVASYVPHWRRTGINGSGQELVIARADAAVFYGASWPGVTVLPSLGAPASALSSASAAWFAGLGVTPTSTDSVLNVLRKVRNAQGKSFPVDNPW